MQSSIVKTSVSGHYLHIPIKCIAFGIYVLFNISLNAQSDTVWQQQPEVTVAGFVDVFYVYDFNKPQGASRQPFLYNHNRHNEVNLNLGLVKFELEHSKYRGNLALQTGTYANDNYVAEPGLLKNIFEANIGISLNKKNNLWFDAGILPSHIGFESAISVDNMTLTRSLLAENSPYFLTGAKLTLQPNQKWEIAGWIGNGWQRIQRLAGNSLASIGTQVCYSPSDNFSVNWSTFVGTNDPDSIRRMRYFSDLYGQFQLSDKWAFIAGFDLGVQQTIKNGASYARWYSPILIAQYTINNEFKTAVRIEHYDDQNSVLIKTKSVSGFKTTGISLNIDYSLAKNIVCRLEGRWLGSGNDIFEIQNGLTNNNYFIATSMALQFSELLRQKVENKPIH